MKIFRNNVVSMVTQIFKRVETLPGQERELNIYTAKVSENFKTSKDE